MKVVWSETLERQWEEAQFQKWRQAMEKGAPRREGQRPGLAKPVSPVRQQLIRRFGSELAVQAAIRRHEESERERQE
jgi:hypothetical protein